MSEKPILFSGPMVTAILEGRKTQTRRVVEPHPDGELLQIKTQPRVLDQNAFIPPSKWKDAVAVQGEYSNSMYCHGWQFCPYGKPGDQLWVRETWQTHQDRDDISPSDLPKTSHIQYPATYDHWDSKKRPSIHMPRWVSRINLLIKDVRVERLLAISAADAVAEGMAAHCDPQSAVELFADLWDKINGKKHPWASNPFVWVIDFEVTK